MGFVFLTMPEIFTINNVFVDNTHFWRQAELGFKLKVPKTRNSLIFFLIKKLFTKLLKVKFEDSKGKNYFYNLLNV